MSSMMMGMKKIKDVNLTAIVTVADDGGSTGRIRDVYHVPAMGDIRHVLCAMSLEENESLFTDLMNYRFEGEEDIGGHSLGNLIFGAHGHDGFLYGRHPVDFTHFERQRTNPAEHPRCGDAVRLDAGWNACAR